MRYLIIGLGIYGSNLARNLTDMGHEVIGADNRKANIDAIKDYISTVYLIDATDEAALSLLPLNNVDLVIVAIGENFGASIKVVAMLKKMKVKHIYARASDPLHESILQGFEIDRILTPEQRAARDLTSELGFGTKVKSMAIDDDHYVISFNVPEIWYGMKYEDIDVFVPYSLILLTVTRDFTETNILSIKHTVKRVFKYISDDVVAAPGDIVTCYGSRQCFKELQHDIQNKIKK